MIQIGSDQTLFLPFCIFSRSIVNSFFVYDKLRLNLFAQIDLTKLNPNIMFDQNKQFKQNSFMKTTQK